MCINGSHTTVLNVRKSKAILAYRHWVIGYESGGYVLRPSFAVSYTNGSRVIMIRNPWREKVAVANRKPSASYRSNFGIHATSRSQRLTDGNPAVGTVRLWGKVVVHRYHEGGPIQGYRAQYARVTSISRSLSSGPYTMQLEQIAKRLGARMVK
jgi:hypothetical protein